MTHDDRTNPTQATDPTPTADDRDDHRDVLFRFPPCPADHYVRLLRLQRIREQLVAGTYDLDDKLDVALDRLWLDLADQDLAEDDDPLDDFGFAVRLDGDD